MVVDSCLDRADGEPVALKYLREMPVDAAAAIELVVATHWHSDHIQGIASVLEAAPYARLWCSAALRATDIVRPMSGLSRRRSRPAAAPGQASARPSWKVTPA
ncbi:MAG: MBL fold metallo-hydrolase [Planctomycetes bacterium]|nr:MBL fold metallo-hydrolase [Planctomycetota bacterium]